MYCPAPGHDKLKFSDSGGGGPSPPCTWQRDAVPRDLAETVELQTPVRSTSTHRHTLLLAMQQLLSARPPPKPCAAPTWPAPFTPLPDLKRSLVIPFSDMLGRSSAEQEAALAALQHSSTSTTRCCSTCWTCHRGRFRLHRAAPTSFEDIERALKSSCSLPERTVPRGHDDLRAGALVSALQQLRIDFCARRRARALRRCCTPTCEARQSAVLFIGCLLSVARK
jgi:hypothetical protein